jgi:anti-anti-sigma factor
MTTPLTVDTRGREDGTYVVVAAGEIDLSNVKSFADALDAAIEAAQSETVAVDLGAVDYLDSGAINALFAHAGRIAVVANPILLPVLNVSGLTELVPVEPAH